MIDLVFYNYETNEWERTTDTQTIKMNECLQELALYLGESWFYGNFGVDYSGLFRGEVDITAQVFSIVEKYRKFFFDIDLQSSRLKDSIIFGITFYFESKSAFGFDIGFDSKIAGEYNLKIKKRS